MRSCGIPAHHRGPKLRHPHLLPTKKPAVRIFCDPYCGSCRLRLARRYCALLLASPRAFVRRYSPGKQSLPEGQPITGRKERMTASSVVARFAHPHSNLGTQSTVRRHAASASHVENARRCALPMSRSPPPRLTHPQMMRPSRPFRGCESRTVCGRDASPSSSVSSISALSRGKRPATGTGFDICKP